VMYNRLNINCLCVEMNDRFWHWSQKLPKVLLLHFTCDALPYIWTPLHMPIQEVSKNFDLTEKECETFYKNQFGH
jgi:hypothetical protein